MKKFLIRFNTECKDKELDNHLCWRALIDNEEFLASDIHINVPTKTISHILENGNKKWSIECESDNFYFDENKKLVINKSEKYFPSVLWFTGLSGAGKTTIINCVIEKLKQNDVKHIVLDGDYIRQSYGDGGSDRESRVRRIINIGCMASLLEREGYMVIVSLLSPFRDAREKCREISNKFIEIYISTPLNVCEKRDVKGLYAKARKGEIKDFTGVDSIYEAPLHPEIEIDTDGKSVKECADIVLNKIVNP